MDLFFTNAPKSTKVLAFSSDTAFVDERARFSARHRGVVMHE
jgi:hypothetical protein